MKKYSWHNKMSNNIILLAFYNSAIAVSTQHPHKMVYNWWNIYNTRPKNECTEVKVW